VINIFFVRPPEDFGFHFFVKNNKKETANNTHNYMWLRKDKENLKNTYKLIFDHKIKTLLLFDIIKGYKDIISIKDHVNISGDNKLIGQTPLKAYPMFPDMTSIYRPSSKHPEKTVYTVGKERFNKVKSENKIISESAGVVAPMFHYFGVTITGFGIPEHTSDKRKTITECLSKISQS
tara:strand:- start:2565 stop:3098 length:534 start_codon:yes stop_codon:yes gene_type:complete